VGASYLQYEDVQCVVKLDNKVSIIEDGEEVTFNYISSSRRAPGRGEHITFSRLADYCKSEQEKKADRIDGWKLDYAHAKKAYIDHAIYESQSDDVKQMIAETSERLRVIHGTPNSKKERQELNDKFIGYKLPVINDSMPWAFGEKGWMTKANSFETVEEFINYKMAE
jgi:hypothetical protein